MSELSSFAAAWWSWMVAMSWQAALLIAVVALLDRLSERAGWAQLRYGLWLLVAVKLALPPGLAASWSIGSLLVARSPDRITGTATAQPVPTESLLQPAVVYVALALWALGAITWLTVTLVRTGRFRRRQLAAAISVPVEIDRLLLSVSSRLGARRPRAVLSPEARAPFVTGLARPTIVLPADAVDRWSRTELQHILLHEVAHIRRRDLWIDACYLLLNAAYWFHPLVHFARRRAHTARELSADALAARLLGDGAPRYRDTLAQVAAETLLGRDALGAGFFDRGSTTCARLRALDRESWRSPGMRSAAAAPVLGALALVLLPMAPQASPSERLLADVATARSQLATVLEDRLGTGSLHHRYAVMALNAAERRFEESQKTTIGEDVE